MAEEERISRAAEIFRRLRAQVDRDADPEGEVTREREGEEDGDARPFGRWPPPPPPPPEPVPDGLSDPSVLASSGSTATTAGDGGAAGRASPPDESGGPPFSSPVGSGAYDPATGPVPSPLIPWSAPASAGPVLPAAAATSPAPEAIAGPVAAVPHGPLDGDVPSPAPGTGAPLAEAPVESRSTTDGATHLPTAGDPLAAEPARPDGRDRLDVEPADRPGPEPPMTGAERPSPRPEPLRLAALDGAAASSDDPPSHAAPGATPSGRRAPHPAAGRPLPRRLAIANQKGGVGKTTTAVNLGAGLAELGYRVLVVDLDPQGNATTGLGINARNLDASIYDVILHDVPLEDVVEATTLRNLFVVPATIDLAGAEIELVPAFSRELRLRRALEAVEGDYDFTLVDCPPSLGLLTVNGLAAATEVLVPIQCEYYALEGLGQLLRNVSLVQANLNEDLELSTIVLTMYDARTRLAEQVAEEVRHHFGDRVCRNIVPRTVRLSEAPSFGQPIILFDPSSRGAIAYRELAKEVSGGAPQRVG